MDQGDSNPAPQLGRISDPHGQDMSEVFLCPQSPPGSSTLTPFFPHTAIPAWEKKDIQDHQTDVGNQICSGHGCPCHPHEMLSAVKGPQVSPAPA